MTQYLVVTVHGPTGIFIGVSIKCRITPQTGMTNNELMTD